MAEKIEGFTLFIGAIGTLIFAIAIFTLLARQKGSDKLCIDDICDLYKLNRFFGNKDTRKLIERLKGMGCTIEDLSNLNTCDPIYINLTVAGTDDRPFIGITEPNNMQDGNVSMWVGIDDDDNVDGVEWQDTPEAMAKVIAERMGVEVTPIITGFTSVAYEMREHINTFNK